MASVDAQDTEFMSQYMKALKFEYEHAATPVAKQQAAQKADELRANAKLLGIDLSAYGPGVRLSDTPGGNFINWNLLSTVGKAWAGMNPTDDVSKWKQSVGTGLTSNLAGYQETYASFAESAAYDTTTRKPAKPAIPGIQPVVSTSSVGQPVQVGQLGDTVRGGARSSGTQAAATPTPSTPSTPSTPGVSAVNSEMQASQALNTQQQKAEGTWKSDQKPLEEPAEGMEWTLDDQGRWQQTPKQSVDNMASNSDMLADFLKQNPDVDPDYTQWDGVTRNRFLNWAEIYVPLKAAESVVNGKLTYDATKEPWWQDYVNMTAASYDATKRSLKTALDLKLSAIKQQGEMVAANYDFQVAEIENAINMANWSSRESMAMSNVTMQGALSYALQANEAAGINKKWLSLQERTSGLNELARQITILTSDYADQGLLLDKAQEAEIGLKRKLYLDGNVQEYNDAMELVETLKGQLEATNIAAPATERLEREANTQAAAQADFDTVVEIAKLGKQGIWLKQDADGNWVWQTGLTDAEQTARDSALFDQWYKTEGLNIDWAKIDLAKDQLALDKAKQAFAEWAQRQGLKLDAAKLDLEWEKLVETNRHNLAGEGSTNGNGGTTDTYMTSDNGFKADMQIVNNPNEVGTNIYQQAVLRVGLGSGGLLANDDAFLMALNGVPKGKTPPWLANILGFNVSGGMAGVLNSADEATVANFADIADEKSPARALELYVAWKIKHPPAGSTPFTSKTWNAAITNYCKDFGTQLGYSQADVTAAITWLTANADKLFGGTP